MQTALTVALCVAVWLYTICVMKNGGGVVSTIAIILASLIAVVAMGWFFSQSQMLFAWLTILSIPAAFLVVMSDANSSDGGWIN